MFGGIDGGKDTMAGVEDNVEIKVWKIKSIAR